uniref:Subtilisin inhibitor domain-containing protein n=1 Tax=Ditylum brightwellii TaxID=49249 RepID=A0A7S2A2J8_9STRA|mmetsp:Transcript_7030/g.10605  ORF Transcript_7030/g.10605 Transcript_7030/m.10605 type:complete len:171 (+) Transcript_7030:55-567(+)
MLSKFIFCYYICIAMATASAINSNKNLRGKKKRKERKHGQVEYSPRAITTTFAPTIAPTTTTTTAATDDFFLDWSDPVHDWFSSIVYTCEIDGKMEIIEDTSALSGPWKECMEPAPLTGVACQNIIEQETYIETVIIADPGYPMDRLYRPCRVFISVDSTGFVTHVPSRG